MLPEIKQTNWFRQFNWMGLQKYKSSYTVCIVQDWNKDRTSPCLLQWPKNLAQQVCWSPAQTGICCVWVAMLPPPCTSGSHRQRFAGVGPRRSRSGCSWAVRHCARDSARSGTPPARQSVPGCRAAGEATGEEPACGHVVWTWGPPWSSCVGSLDPRCHAERSDRPGHPCRYGRSAARSRCRLAVPCRTPLPVPSSPWRPKIPSCTWGSCTAGSLSRGNKIQREQKKQDKSLRAKARNSIQP